ncbi:MAG: DUF885 family protein, partial [Thermoplasmatota archaeon]
STGTIDAPAAVERLSEETGMTREEATAEVKRYTLSPGYNLSYMIGRVEIERLRDEAGGNTAGGERAFHDRFLDEGSLPISLMRRAVLRRGPTESR